MAYAKPDGLNNKHTTFTAIFKLYPYLVQTWNEICHPSDEEQLYPEGNHWNWDSEPHSYANELRHTFCKFEYIVVFLIATNFWNQFIQLLNAFKEDYRKFTLALKRLMK